LSRLIFSFAFMRTVEDAYDQWAGSYDEVINPTRDLDHKAMKAMLGECSFDNVLELGCGTGKNTGWFSEQASFVTSVDLSSEMLAVAREKIRSDKVEFIKGDINQDLVFNKKIDLVSCNLVLEHIANLEKLFEKVSALLNDGGLFFICELHPIKQYMGSKARFEKDNELIIVDCYTHHLTDYLRARDYGFQLEEIREWFDEGLNEIPRLITFLFRK
jgi:predicted TPR repeat methyltransferase